MRYLEDYLWNYVENYLTVNYKDTSELHMDFMWFFKYPMIEVGLQVSP